MKKFQLKSAYAGYQAKKDITNLYPSNTSYLYLVSPSQNVIINDGEKVGIRSGYTLDGVANAALTPITASYEWPTSSGTELALRAFEDTLQVRYGGVWTTIMTGFTTSSYFKFTTWWDSTEVKDLLLFVNGTSNIYMWSGAFATFASATANTITKQGAETWAENRFLIGGTRTLVLGGITYTYTGGEGTTTLTGVTPDPTAGGHSVGNAAYQAVRTSANQPYSGAKNNLIEMARNQIYIASLTRRDVYVSKNTSYTDYTFTANRLPGEGAILTLDGNVVGFIPQEDSMYITAGSSDWYQTKFTLSTDNTKEALTIEKLKNGPLQAAQSQDLIGKIKNSVVFVSKEPTYDTLGRIENIDTPQAQPLSDPIKDDFDLYDFTRGHVKFFRGTSYIALPAESKLLMYDHTNQYWQAPQTLPAGRLAIIGGELYLHSNVVPETYKLFEGTSDNEMPINAKAAFGYENYDRRYWKKNFDEWFTEGYISNNTDLLLTINYDYKGFTSVKDYTISGDSDPMIFETSEDASLGKNPLGQEPLGSTSETPVSAKRFRNIKTTVKQDFYEVQPIYSSYDNDQSWELLAFGPNAMESSTDNVFIKD